MRLSTPATHVPDTSITFPTWLRSHLGWLFVAAVVVATATMGILVAVDGDETTARVVGSETRAATFNADHGSIAAVEHRAAVAAAATVPSLHDKSITAIDHSTTAGAAAATVPSLHDKSITAIEHGASAGAATATVPSLHDKSITAIEHGARAGG